MEEGDGDVVIAFGGNLPGSFDSPEALLADALGRFADHGLAIRRLSSLWRSAAWPDPSEPPYLNGVALVDTALAAPAVLAALHEIERLYGRERGRRNAPRTLDLDLIAHGARVGEEDGLILPHPRAHERLFVMGPLAEVAPGWRHPVSGETAAALAQQAPVGRDAEALGALQNRTLPAI